MKKIINLLIATLVLLSATPLLGQGKYGKDSAECIKYLSYYKEYLNQGNITESAPLWRKAFSICPPQASQNMILDGAKIMRSEIRKFKNNPIRYNNLVDTLFMLHDVRIATFPKYKTTALINKASDMINYIGASDKKKTFDICQEAMAFCKGKVTVPIIVRYMDFAIQMYTEGSMGAEEVMTAFQNATSTIDLVQKELVRTNKNTEDAEKAKTDIENLFMQSGVANCDNLVDLFTPRFEENPNDKDIVSNIVILLSSSNCLETDLFRRAVESLYQIEKKHNWAYMLFKLYSQINENDKAVAYMQEAIDLEDSDANQDSEYYFELGTFIYKKMNNPAKAIEAAKNAAQLSPAIAGKAYLLIGTIWGSQKCQGNDIEVRAPFWVAVDYLNKAKNADSTLATDANAMIDTFTKYFPMQSEAFMFDVIDGDSYTVACGSLRETTKVRTQK